MSDVPFEDAPWMPAAPSAEDLYLAAQEEDPLDCLTERQRFVVELRFGLRDGVHYTQREVAELMGVSLKTVWEHERAARKKLEAILKETPVKTPRQKD